MPLHLAILLLGGTGKDGKRKLIGWRSKVSICRWHLQDMKLFGRRFSSWGGPLPQSWLDQQLILQKKILFRMYELGMTPVLPAFSGNVPVALKYIFPSAKIIRLGNWFSVKSDLKWCCTYLLDATDSLFIEIGRAFIEQQLKEYGRTSHIYNWGGCFHTIPFGGLHK
ncbi:hypothetical protein I3760_11G031600 [Carya illinoinensis]|nr:hypothetical protein I3760_11G031600 [Carya illinoinensis]